MPSDLDAAYAGLLKHSADRAGEWAGWKLGGTNHGTQAAFGVDRAYFGPLHVSEILEAPARAPARRLCELKGEVEIALRLDATGAGHDAWAVALEMPAAAVENLPAAGVAALVADRCGAGALLLGPVRQGRVPDLSGARFALRANGAVLSEAGLEALTGSPEALLAEFLDIARAQGFAPAPGDWVATGGITACCGFAEGDRIEVLRDGRTELDFRADCAE